MSKFIIDGELLDQIIAYIEQSELIIDGEWGSCRDVDELIRDNCMPDLYIKLNRIKEEEE